MLNRIAAELGVAQELLLAEAIAVHQQFANAGIVSDDAKLALVAAELAMTKAELRREVDAVLEAC